ncbi:MAG: translation initiation factor IF-3 [Patescibacteria group bacterium]
MNSLPDAGSIPAISTKLQLEFNCNSTANQWIRNCIRVAIEFFKFLKIINYRINNQITAPELRVINEDGTNLGVMSREEALKLAEEKGLDLVEITATAKPPIAKIISFDKFRYQKEKELKKQKASQKVSGLKQVRISARAAKNDLEIRAKKIQEFLEAGHKVEIMLILKGREKYNRDWARHKLDEFIKMITSDIKITMEPRFGGKGLVMQIIKK